MVGKNALLKKQNKKTLLQIQSFFSKSSSDEENSTELSNYVYIIEVLVRSYRADIVDKLDIFENIDSINAR